VVRLDYEWDAQQRLQYATGLDFNRAVGVAAGGAVRNAEVRWQFSGSPVTLHRVQMDRDLYYRAAELEEGRQPDLRGPAFGTHPANLAVLGEDHFYMLGDNSQASLDSRLWGYPHPIVAEQVDKA